MTDETEINAILKEKNKYGWSDTIDNCFCGVNEISAKLVKFYPIEVSNETLIEILEGEPDHVIAEVLLAIQEGEYTAELYEGDDPRDDFVTLNVCGFEFTL